MKKVLSLLITLFLFQHPSFAQDTHLVDSLENKLKHLNATKIELGKNVPAMYDTTAANILYLLCKIYWSSNGEKAMDYTKRLLSLSEQIGYKKGLGNAYNSIGAINMQKEDYSAALEFYKKALKIREGISDKKGIAISYSNIGNVYYSQSIYSEALKNQLIALKIRKETGDKYMISDSYNRIGNIYSDQCDFPEALKNYFASLKIAEETGDKNNVAIAYGNIGSIYTSQGNYPEALKNLFASLKILKEIGDKNKIAVLYNNIGIIYVDQGNYPEALKNYFVSLKLTEEIGDKNGIARSYNNIGLIYMDQGNYPEALTKTLAALKIKEEIGNKSGIAYSYCIIGEIYIKEKKYNDAFLYLDKALSLSKELGLLNIVRSSYADLATLDSIQGNFKQALEHYKLFITVRDSLMNNENTKKITQQQMQFEFDKEVAIQKAEEERKDAIEQKELQKQKFVRNGFIAGFAVVLLFAGLFFRQRNKISKAKKLSEAEKERSEELLLNILPAAVATELKQTGQCQPKTYNMVTVMFADFIDFTRVSEKVSAELLVGELNYCFSAFDTILQKHKIEKIKTVGDAYLCASGLPILTYTHAVDMVTAALEMKNFILDRQKEKEGKGEIAFEVRIGIHTGSVVAGIVGTQKFSYDIWGDTVNIAARMESSSEAGQVNISGTTRELVKDKFKCTYRGKIEAKHKGEIDMYFVDTANHAQKV